MEFYGTGLYQKPIKKNAKQPMAVPGPAAK